MADHIEGKRAVIEALRTHVPIKEILIADNLKKDSLVEDILRKSKNREVEVKPATRSRLDKMGQSENHQGVIAIARPYQYCNVQRIIDCGNEKMASGEAGSLVILLDHITDSGNLGAIARSAEVVGASGVIIPNKRSAHITASSYKTSAGAVSHINISQVANIAQSIQRLKDEGYWIAGASEHASEIIWKSNLKGKIALVFGNEGTGLSRLTKECCDFLCKLPVAGELGSLNVAQASTACMYEWLRQNTQI